MKERRRLPLLLIAAALLAIAGGLIWALHLSIEASIAQHEAELAVILDDVAVRVRARPALAGPEEPGNAWDLLRPAFDALWEMSPQKGDLSAETDALFNIHGPLPEAVGVLKASEPWLENCRRATRRTRLEWHGPKDPDLSRKMVRVGRALCSRAFLAWQAGRDEEALEWLTVALTVAQDAAHLGNWWTWRKFEGVESAVIAEVRTMSGDHTWTAPQLVEFERRLDLLHGTRPPPAVFFQGYGAIVRNTILKSEIWLMPVPPKNESPTLYSALGWRDLHWKRLFTSRVLTGVRNEFRDAGALPLTSTTDPAARAREIRAPYRKEDVARLFDQEREIEFLVDALQRLETLRIAAAVARAQAVLGRAPRTVEEAGISSEFGRQFRIEAQDSAVKIVHAEETWTLQRRQR